MKRILCILFLFCLLTTSLSSAFADVFDDDDAPPKADNKDTAIVHVQDTKVETEKTYYNDQKQGWWWYKDPPSAKKKDDKNSTPAGSPAPLSPQNYTANQLWNMSPKELGKLYDSVRDQAIQTPTQQNIKDFQFMTDLMSTKALAFTNANEAFISQHPTLNMDYEYPTNIPGSTGKMTMQDTEVNNEIAKVSKDYGIMFFYSNTCEYCEKQAGILQIFKREFPDMDLKSIEINNDPNLANFFKIETVPSIMLVYRNAKDAIPISVGVIDASSLKQRIYRGMRLFRGDTTPESFDLYDFQKGTGLDSTKEGWEARQQRNGFLNDEQVKPANGGEGE